MAKFIVIDFDIIGTLRTWTNGLKNLSFADNFKGYEWEGEIPASEIVKITHPLKVIPTRFLVLDNFGGSTPLMRPDTPKADSQFFYLTCGSDFQGKVLIMP